MYLKDNVWNSVPCSCGNGKYLESILNNSMIVCDEVKELYNEETNFNEKSTCKTQNVCILLAFLLIIIALLIVVCIYCNLIKIPNNKDI